MSSRGMPPGRNSCGGSVVQSTIVLSTPIGEGPPSRITSLAGWSIVTEVGEHVGGRRRADPAEGIRRRGGDAPTCTGQQLLRHRVGGRAQADGVPAAGHGVEHPRGARQQHGERSWPARGGEQFGRRRNLGGPRIELVGAPDVHDEGVTDRPALHGEDPGDRGVVVGVGAEAVHRLGRDCHQAAADEALDRGETSVVTRSLVTARRRGTRAWRR